MMRITSTLTLALSLTLLVFTSFAKPVSESEARAAGLKWLTAHGWGTGANELSTTYISRKNDWHVTQNLFYIFSGNGGDGWVIVSGDDRIQPILAYATHGKIDMQHMAPATRSWLAGYGNQIAYVLGHNALANAGNGEQWAALGKAKLGGNARTTSVTPLLTTTWDEAPYYNAYCPYDFTYSSLTETGSVATAMAQVMKYWNWPIRGCGFHAYDDVTYGRLSADFGSTLYDWSDMPNVISVANNAVAELMFHAGVSTNTVYGTDAATGSYASVTTAESAGTPCAEYALKANFRYKSTLHSLIRFGRGAGSGYDSVTDAALLADLVAELESRRPVIYSGANDSFGKHCWVCDGYDATFYFHFNWGWGGYSDGYFSLNNIAPAALAIGGASGNYNFDQTMIIGIEPASIPPAAGNLELISCLSSSNTPAKYGQPFSVTTKIFNTSFTEFHGDFSAQLFDSSDNFVDILQVIPSYMLGGNDSTVPLTFSTTGMYNLPSGLYGLRIYSRRDGDTSWQLVANNGDLYNYTKIGIYNDTDLALRFNALVTPGVLYHNAGVYVSATLSNNGLDNFYGNIKATLNSINDGSELFNIEELVGSELDTNMTLIFDFANSALNVDAGLYALEIQHQYFGAGNYVLTGSTFAANPLMVKVDWAEGTPKIAPVKDIVIYPNPAKDVLHIAFQGLRASSATIVDLLGKVVKKIDCNGAPSATLLLDGFTDGVYTARFVTDQGTVVRKFVVER